MLSKRKLTLWRIEALKHLAASTKANQLNPKPFAAINPTRLANERILAMTQELIDQHLLAETLKGEK